LGREGRSTIARAIVGSRRKATLGVTWALLPPASMPLHGRLEQIGIVEFPPARELFVCDLASGGRRR